MPERKELQKTIAYQLRQVAPEMQEEMASFLKSPTELNAYFPILKFPVMRPYIESGFGRFDIPSQTLSVMGDNWWSLDSLKNEEKQKLEIDFLTEKEKNDAKKELEKLISVGNSSNFLTQKAIDFAKESPQAPIIPELLYHAVRTTRYGDRSDNIGAQSQTAFNLLHKNYPNNDWTKKTPFWFN